MARANGGTLVFAGKSNSEARRGNDTTIIARGTEVSGRIEFSGFLDVEGTVRGDIVANEGDDQAQVRVINGGEIIGDVCAPVVIVNSEIRGNVYSASRVELAADAIVCGDIHYQAIEMVKGAQINGGLVYAAQSDSLETAVSSMQELAPECATSAE